MNAEKIICSHCSDTCSNDTIRIDDKVFCCEGCKTVYEILGEHQLFDYYTMDAQPGITPGEQFEGKFTFLDNQQVLNKVLSFNDDGVAVVQFNIPTIHCSSCIWLLEQLASLQKGVLSSQVNFIKKQVKITYATDKVLLSKIVSLMATIGYEPLINLEMLSGESAVVDKSESYRLGIAGFCFGNIMLLSLADYFGMNKEVFSTFSSFFNYLNLLLALPVFFYSARPYFTSALKGLKQRWLNIDVPIALGILVLFFRSAYEVISGYGTGYFDSLSGLVFFLLIGKYFQNKTYQHLSFERDYKSYFPMAVTLVKEEKEHQVAVNKLKKGDVILIRNGELIPADCTLRKGMAQIDNSFVTGESKTIVKNIGDLIYAGGRQMTDVIELEVQQAVSQSYLTQLWNNAVFNKNTMESVRTVTDRISKYFTIVILLIAAVSAFYWGQTDMGKAINVVSAILIVACPCALALAAPFALGNTLRIFGDYKFYLKNTMVIEALSNLDHIVFDKTGTLTVSGASEVLFVGNKLSAEQEQLVKSLCRNSNHPLSRIIYNSIDLPLVVLSDFKQEVGKGITANYNGQNIIMGSASYLKVDTVQENMIVHVAVGEEYLGYYKIESQKRTGLSTTLSRLKHYMLHLISGDNESDKDDMKVYFQQDKMLFNMQPSDKLSYISSLQKTGAKVLMIGDGLNDAGALKQAHVGLSVSEDINAFSPACDGIIDAQVFEKLPAFIQFSKKAMWVVYISFVISFIYNIGGLYFAVQGELTPIFAAILMPISSITVVGFVTIATNFLSKKLI